MKKTIAMAVLLLVTAGHSNAQCDKRIKWTSARTIFLDSSLNTVKTDVEKVVIELGKNDVRIIPNGPDDEIMTGNVYGMTCNWKDAGKNGKTVFKSELADKRGDLKHALITIEGINGKISILLEAQEVPVKIRLEDVNFEEMR